MSRFIAVLTGDVIESRRVRDRTALYRLLDARLARLAERHAGVAERFRGDGFQLALPTAGPAMDAAVTLRAALIAHSEPDQRWDARIALAVGPGSLDGDGPTFVASGRSLDVLTEGDTHLALHLPDGPDPGLALLVRYLDDLIDGWSRYSAEAVSLALPGTTSQQAMAERLGIRQPSVHKRLKVARWDLLADTLGYLEERLAGAGGEHA